MLKVIRRLARNGNSTTVTIPPRFLRYVRWEATDGLVLEITPRNTIEIRRATLEDMNGVEISPMSLGAARGGGK